MGQPSRKYEDITDRMMEGMFRSLDQLACQFTQEGATERAVEEAKLEAMLMVITLLTASYYPESLQNAMMGQIGDRLREAISPSHPEWTSSTGQRPRAWN